MPFLGQIKVKKTSDPTFSPILQTLKLVTPNIIDFGPKIEARNAKMAKKLTKITKSGQKWPKRGPKVARNAIFRANKGKKKPLTPLFVQYYGHIN